MKEPYWLTRDECLALHDMMLSFYGGITGLPDEHLLESALAGPRQLFHYGKPSMAEMAAAYAAGIVKNYPFLDGNKRTGFMLGAGFLERNGHEFHATEADAVVSTLALAAGAMTEAEYAGWLEANSKRP
ncbi:type II toxin-antitoxin system death-on-curing family toxin [Prosthecobacter fluviatilis]|uniref:Type II toxin-antitoxin system death-on-curing family toxin n=1 Tax=Prosthecobacter fluviatilis TaxID=445931 RepID=A0ABW0KVN6_9BACT